MKVLSLCDGMSCGQIALRALNIPIEKYYAAEIKNIAIKVTQNNYPDTIQIGDVNNISYHDGILSTEKGDFKENFDLIIFGAPCQSFSNLMIANKRIGLADPKRSGLFLECYRILKEVNPTYFLSENVASMKREDKNTLSEYLQVEPIKIDAAIVSPALRKRYYWTNIPITHEIIPNDIKLSEILDNGYTDREKARCLTVSDSRPLSTPIKMFHRYYRGFQTLIFKSEKHYIDCVNTYKLISNDTKIAAKELDKYLDIKIFDGVRYLNQTELERCQYVPKGYTSCLSRNDAANVLGDGWNIEVIKYLFSGLK